MHNKKCILDDYQKKFGKDSNDSIVARKKGKISDNTSLDCSQMRPSLDKWYRVGDLHLYNVITTIIKECRVTFSKEDFANPRLVNKDYADIVPKVFVGYELTSHLYASLVWDTKIKNASIHIMLKWLVPP